MNGRSSINISDNSAVMYVKFFICILNSPFNFVCYMMAGLILDSFLASGIGLAWVLFGVLFGTAVRIRSSYIIYMYIYYSYHNISEENMVY